MAEQKEARMKVMGNNCLANEQCTKLFSIRQYVLLSRQKDVFSNWPFPERFLRLCLNYGVTNVLPPFVALDLSDQDFKRSSVSVSADREKIAIAGDDSVSFDDEVISILSEQVKLMSLSSKFHMKEKDNGSDVHGCGEENAEEPMNGKKIAYKCGRKSRKGRPKKKSLREIFANAKRCALEETNGFNDLSCCSEFPQTKKRQQREKVKVDFDCSDSESELTVEESCGKKSRKSDDGVADQNNRLAKRRQVLDLKLAMHKMKS